MNIPDNYDRWKEHDARQQAQLDRLPVCCECGEPIQDVYLYEINDELICEQCLKDNHRKFTDDFME